MTKSHLFLALLTFATATSVGATTRSFQVHGYQQLTSNVDRLFARDRAGFANIFCRHDAAEVFFVDARYPEFDGVSFLFPNVEACLAAKSTIRATYRKCITEVRLNTTNRSAEVLTSRCRQ